MDETTITLSAGGLPPFSARGCRQTLSPINNGDTYRTVNGELVTVVSALHHKYQTLIKGEDKLPIALDTLWKGQPVEVGCMQRLWQKTDGVAVTLSRTPVADSVVAINDQRSAVPVIAVAGRQVTLEAPGYVGYRPRLMMKITDFGYESEEWGKGGNAWFIKLEEV